MCVCVCAIVSLWLFPYSGSLAGAIDGADNAHSPGHLLVTWLQLPNSQLGGGFWPMG